MAEKWERSEKTIRLSLRIHTRKNYARAKVALGWFPALRTRDVSTPESPYFPQPFYLWPFSFVFCVRDPPVAAAPSRHLLYITVCFAPEKRSLTLPDLLPVDMSASAGGNFRRSEARGHAVRMASVR